MLNNIWNFFPYVPVHIDERELVKRCQILNERALTKAGYPSWKTFSINEFPIAQLVVKMENFELDILHFGARCFVSEKLRDAMGLDSSGVLYFDVDASRSSRPVRDKNFKIMEVTAVENVSIPEKSKYKLFDSKIEGLPPGKSIYSIAMREDAAPGHALFRDHFFTRMFCTDELAVRVLKAGCIGVSFLDPAQMSVGAPMRFRTLRGIEELVDWDPVNRTETWKLVRSVH